jgi:predicted RNA-binding Zn-ribbon protein involved in translation (DUF1610 family)
MSKSLRLSEKWFRRGLWLVAFIFGGFLIGLGSTVVGDLPQVEGSLSQEQFIDKTTAAPLQEQIRQAELVKRDADRAVSNAQLQHEKASADVGSAQDSFNNWLGTRSATQRGDQDPEVISRNKALDTLRQAERKQLAAIEALEQKSIDAQQSVQLANDALQPLREAADQQLYAAERRQELRVFGYRLALTLPLLAIAGWLFVKKRKSTYWPFVWGFIYFALFAFFVELVPYLPSYGGYVRYIVGIIITLLVGRYAILALNRYLEKQKLAEALPDAQRREELSYDVALARLAKSVCPGCERNVDLKNTSIDFCPHCGIGLHDHCGNCQTRKSAFSKFCHSCGTGAKLLPELQTAA